MASSYHKNSDYSRGKPRQDGNRDKYRDPNNKTNKALQAKYELQQKWKSSPREFLFLNERKPLPISIEKPFSADIFKDCQDLNTVCQKVTLEEVLTRSNNFWEEFPSETARVKSLMCHIDPARIERCISSVYPIVHSSTLLLMKDFLAFKRIHGTSVEKELYRNMNVISFVDRLIKMRPLSFLGANDQYLLRGGIIHGYGGFQTIGSEKEDYPLVLEKYLSYDEMRIAALISVSSWSIFVNDGCRKNYGYAGEPGTFQDEGVIVGQVGTRLKKEGVMDYLDCVITKEENLPSNGFGSRPMKPHINQVWSKYWEVPLLTYEEAHKILRDKVKQAESGYELMPIGRDLIFNVTIYKKRIAITAEILMCEANTRAQRENKKAYIHVVGLGLGVWRASAVQETYFVEAWGDALDNMKDTKHIGIIDFSYIDVDNIKGCKTNNEYRTTGIKVKFSKRNLHDKVPEDHILVCNYAWDGNSYPGNEFYLEKLCSTGDSAAACSSMVAEVHNYEVNPFVQGERVMIASAGGYVEIWDQCQGAGKQVETSKKSKTATSEPSNSNKKCRVTNKQNTNCETNPSTSKPQTQVEPKQEKPEALKQTELELSKQKANNPEKKQNNNAQKSANKGKGKKGHQKQIQQKNEGFEIQEFGDGKKNKNKNKKVKC